MASNVMKPLRYCQIGQFRYKGRNYRSTLTPTTLSLEKESSSHTILIPVRFIIAVYPCDCSQTQGVKCRHCQQSEPVETTNPSQIVSELLPLNTQALKIHYALPKGKYLWRMKTMILYPREECNAREWITAVRELIQSSNRPKSLLVFVNPIGGKKRGPKIYEKKVAGIFKIAGIKTDVVETERVNHARDMIQAINLEKYDGVVGVGGDGMLAELVNGLVLRTQNDASLNPNNPDTVLKRPSLTLGIIPAGSTDTVAFSASGTNDVVTSALLIAMGDKIGLDVVGVHNDNGFLCRYAISFLSYGFFADVLVESEKYRWMGPMRYDFAGFLTFLRQKSYEGKVTMEVLSPNSIPAKDERCLSGCTTCFKARSKSNPVVIKDCPTLTSDTNWVTVYGKFKAMNSASISCRCDKSKNGASPSAHLGDGCTDVIIVKKCSAFGMLRFLIRTATFKSSPFTLPQVEFYRVRQFFFSPYVKETQEVRQGHSRNNSDIGLTNVIEMPTNVKTSSFNCDGEILKETEISARVHCQLINLYGRGIEYRDN